MAKRRFSLRARQEERAAYPCLIPAFLGLSLITYLPLISVFALGFYKWRGTSSPVFVGLQNYIRLFTTDPFFMDSIRVTVVFSLVAVAGSMVYTLLVAMLLNRRIPARGFFRAAFYVPYILPLAAVYIGWSWLYEPNIGLFSYILSSMGVTGFKFLLDSKSVLPSLAVISVWLSGNLIVIFLAGLQNVPRVYHEAGEIDGANAWDRFIHITVPCMSPIIFYNLLMSLIANMQIIVPALSITTGGPSKGSMFMTYLMYDQGFVNGQLGYASAISFLLFCLIGVFTAILFATSGKMVFYEGGDDK
jgi:multiple sugar transport system permease protein